MGESDYIIYPDIPITIGREKSLFDKLFINYTNINEQFCFKNEDILMGTTTFININYFYYNILKQIITNNFIKQNKYFKLGCSPRWFLPSKLYKNDIEDKFLFAYVIILD